MLIWSPKYLPYYGRWVHKKINVLKFIYFAYKIEINAAYVHVKAIIPSYEAILNPILV